MKKKIILIFVAFIIFSTDVKGEIITIDDFEIKDSINVLEKGNYGNIDFNQIIEYIGNGEIVETIKYIVDGVYKNTIGDVAVVEKTIINLVIIILISAFFTNFAGVFSKDNVSDTGFYICYLIVITFIISLFDVFIDMTSAFVTMLLQFVSAIVPGYLMSVALFNQVTAVGFYQIIIIVIAITQFIFLQIVIPLVKVFLAISLVNNISKEDLLSKTTNLIERIISFLNKGLLGLVTGINMVQCLILPAIDSTKNNTLKKIVGALPVIGDGTETVANVLMGSANLIKNTIGVFAIAAIIIVCAIPYIKILIYSLSMQLASAIVQPIADSRITESLACLSTSIGMLLKVIVYNGLLFILSMAIVCTFTSS